MDNKKIGQRIKQAREALGMTQAELARRMGYSARSTINRIENGSQAFPMKKLDKFAQVLDVTPASLAGFTEADIPDGLNKEYYIDYIHDSNNPDFLAAIEGTPSDDLCIKIKASDLDDSEVDYMDKQLDFIVGQRK
jgi:transcriptional regulator with XRE-family HTH domain